MKIKIKTKTYEQNKIKGRIVRSMLSLQELSQDNFGPQQWDMLLNFLVIAFDNKFTTEDLEDLEVSDLMSKFREITDEINEKMAGKVEKFEKK